MSWFVQDADMRRGLVVAEAGVVQSGEQPF
jgi:hypothetical protein